MTRRFLAKNLKCLWVPELVAYHDTPASRCTKEYVRARCYDDVVTNGMLARSVAPLTQHLFGLPRWQYKSAIEGLFEMIAGAANLRPEVDAFRGELRIRRFCWTLIGRHFRRSRESWDA